MYIELLKQHQEKIAMSCGGGELGYTSELHESRIKVERFYERQFTTTTTSFCLSRVKSADVGYGKFPPALCFRGPYPKMNT